MPADRETIIRLSLVVERLRSQVKDAEEQLVKRRANLDEAIANLDAALAAEAPAADGAKARAILDEELHKGLQRVLAMRPADGSSSKPGANVLHAKPMTEEERLRFQHELRKTVRLVQHREAATQQRLDSDVVREKWVSYGGGDPKKSIAQNIREMFEQNPTKSITTAEIVFHLNLPRVNPNAIRQALKRLYDRRLLIREREGVYMLNTATDLILPAALDDDDDEPDDFGGLGPLTDGLAG